MSKPSNHSAVLQTMVTPAMARRARAEARRSKMTVSAWLRHQVALSVGMLPKEMAPSIIGQLARKPAPAAVPSLVTYNGKLIDEREVLGDRPPKVGDKIYVPASDDGHGGCDIVTEVAVRTSSGEPTWFVATRSLPATAQNWVYLSLVQESLRAAYGDTWATPIAS